MDVTTTVFGRHQTGYVFPMLLVIKALPNSFAGAMQRLHTTDNFILFATKSLVVSGASADSLRLLGDTQAIAVDDGDLKLSSFLPPAALQSLISGNGDQRSRSRTSRTHRVSDGRAGTAWATR